MKCPNDGAVLTMSERSGVEIDYCPECRGVWLDRGELDKILDRVAAETPGRSPAGRSPAGGYPAGLPAAGIPGAHRATHRAVGHYQGSRRPKKKEHWLSELFD